MSDDANIMSDIETDEIDPPGNGSVDMITITVADGNGNNSNDTISDDVVLKIEAKDESDLDLAQPTNCLEEVLYYMKSGMKYPPSFYLLEPNDRLKKQNTLRKYVKCFLYEDGVLYYHGQQGGLKEDEPIPRKGKVLFTREEIEEVLSTNHIQKDIHLGEKRLQNVIRSNYYWRSVTEDVKKWVANCPVCQTTPRIRHKATPNYVAFYSTPDSVKAHMKRARPRVSPMSVTGPWELIQLQLHGPLPVTTQGYKFVLTVTCYFSKWIEAEPLTDTLPVTIFQGIMKVCYRWGMPVRVITNSDDILNNELLKEHFFVMYGIQHLVMTTDEVDSDDDSNLSYLRHQLLKISQEDGNDWQLYLDQICWDLRSSVNEATKHTPFEIMFGRKPRFDSEPNTHVIAKAIYLCDPYPNEIAKFVAKKDEMRAELLQAVLAHQKRTKESKNIDRFRQSMKEHKEERHTSLNFQTGHLSSYANPENI